jgi:hypothetical protein
MPVELLYIYRRDATNTCALTGEKNDPRLPAPLAPDRWQFWMQISCHQTEEGLHGFPLKTAVTQIAARGYYLFTGSASGSSVMDFIASRRMAPTLVCDRLPHPCSSLCIIRHASRSRAITHTPGRLLLLLIQVAIPATVASGGTVS